MKSKTKITIVGLLMMAAAVSLLWISGAHAQETGQKAALIATTNIYNAEVVSFEKGTFKLAFELNNGETAQSNVQYLVRLYQGEADSQIVVDEKIYPEIINLSANQTIKKEIDYTAPKNLNGDYQLYIFAQDSKGTVLALNTVGLITLGDTEAGTAFQNTSVAPTGGQTNTFQYAMLISAVLFIVGVLAIVIVKKRKNKASVLPVAIIVISFVFFMFLGKAEAALIMIDHTVDTYGNSDWRFTANMEKSEYYPSEMLKMNMYLALDNIAPSFDCNGLRISWTETDTQRNSTTSKSLPLTACGTKFTRSSGLIDTLGNFNIIMKDFKITNGANQVVAQGNSTATISLPYSVVKPPRPSSRCGTDANTFGMTSAPTNVCALNNNATWSNSYGNTQNNSTTYYPNATVEASDIKEYPDYWYWTCTAKDGDAFLNSVSCKAFKQEASPDAFSSLDGKGVCGTANAYQNSKNTYPISAMSYGNDAFCASGTISSSNTGVRGFTPDFPQFGKWGSRWYCFGSDGVGVMCQAKRESACLSSTTGYCKEGTTKNPGDLPTNWNCEGYGSVEKCSDDKTSGFPAPNTTTGAGTATPTQTRHAGTDTPITSGTDKCQVSPAGGTLRDGDIITIKCQSVKNVSIGWGSGPKQVINSSGDAVEILMPYDATKNASLNVAGGYERGIWIFKKEINFSNQYNFAPTL